MAEQQTLLGLAGLVILGTAAQWLAWRLNLPSILLLLIGGVLAGPVTGLIEPDAIFGRLLVPVVSLSVSLILFEGSLSLKISELPKLGHVVRNLIGIGALVTWTAASVAAYFLLGLGPGLSILLGAILVVTGPTVIGPMLRHVRPQGATGTILKWEGILIDPVGATLAVLVFEVLLASGPGHAVALVLAGLLKTVVLGGAVGAAGAALLLLLLHRYWVPDFLHSPMSLVAVLGVFVSSNSVQRESGLLAVTVMGFILANQKWVNVKHIVEFKENLRVLLLSMLFVLLSARLKSAELRDTALPSLGLLAWLAIVVRPVAVAVSTLGSPLSGKERVFLSCMAPRGIVAAGVASVFALQLAEAGHPEAQKLVPVTFIVIMGAAAFYGLLALPVARWAGLSQPHPNGVLLVGAHPWGRALALRLRAAGCPVLLVDTNPANIESARSAGLGTHAKSILSEKILDELDLAGIGRLLALTSNDELNTLAAQRFANVFGRSEVYRLASKEDAQQDGGGKSHQAGRILFGPGRTYALISDETDGGAEIESWRLTEPFDAWQRRTGSAVALLAVVSAKGELRVPTADNAVAPQPGDTAIGLVSKAGGVGGKA